MVVISKTETLLCIILLLGLHYTGLSNCLLGQKVSRATLCSSSASTCNKTMHSDTKGRRARNIFSNLWKKLTKKGEKESDEWNITPKEGADLFRQYYECLKKRVAEGKDMQSGKLMPVHAFLILSGETVTMTCLVCMRPDQDKRSQLAVWQHVRRSDSSFGPVIPDGERVTITKQSSLIIKETRVGDAGQYTCLDRGEFAAVYQVDILMKERRKMVRFGGRLQGDTYLTSHNLVVLTVWAAWGECDTCNDVGYRQRRGTCVVKKLYPHQPVKPNDFPLMTLFPEGIPCRSTAVPVQLRFLRVIRHRLEETLVDKCNVTCPTQPPPVIIMDSEGKPIELLEEGYQSMGEKPSIPKSTKRKVLYEPEGTHLVLTCTSGIESDSEFAKEKGVRWMRGKKRVDPLTIRRRTRGRVWVDSSNRLHIKQLMLSDTAVYNCWERMQHLVAIKVLVIDGMNQYLRDYITYGGLGFTVVGCLVSCCCLLQSKSKKTAK